MATPRRASSSRSARRTPTRSRAAEVPESIWTRHRRDVLILVLGVLGVLVLLAQLGALGALGHPLTLGLKYLLGVSRIVIPLLLIALALALLSRRVDLERARFGWGIGLALVAVSGLGDVLAGRPSLSASAARLGEAGGWLGVLAGGGLARLVGSLGAVVILSAVLLVAIMVGASLGLRTLLSSLFRGVRFSLRHLGRWWVARPKSSEEEDVDGDEEELEEAPPEPRRRRERPRPPRAAVEEAVEPDGEMDAYDPWEHADSAPHTTRSVVPEPDEPDEEQEEDSPVHGEYDFSAEVEDPGEVVVPESHRDEGEATEWELPPLGLLQRTRAQAQDRAVIEAAGRDLVSALQAHGVDTHLIGFTVGPTVTRYELELGPGVKVARVTSLNKDIAYAMASPDVRILAPIPGRSAIGVEVPNRQRALVALGDLLSSEEALASTHPLDVPIGRDIAGKTVVVNLGEMPHVLISGATGAGKSSCINSLITSLVMRASPDQVRLILVDPKRVELGQYGDLPHLLAPVVVDPKKAAGALAWAVKEMERRYDILAASGTRDITGYQQALARGDIQVPPSAARLVAESLAEATGLEPDVEEDRPETLPYIVIVVDELNDLMMVAARDVEESVVRIAQMARAVGIHLVLATQRPSVDVITGVIKANVPSRMAFAVSSLADSRVILDQAGAERLIGKGDMLLVTASSNIARRLQSPWVSEEEVRRVVQYWRAQGGTTETVVALDARGGRGAESGDEDDDDGLLRRARELVIRTQSGSTSMLQRKLRVGFARAGRLMDELENQGVVGPGDGSKARKVLISPDELDDGF